MKVAFAFTVSDLNSGRLLGGGMYPDLEGEAGFNIANREFERIFPKREVHVEEISVEQYLKDGGTLMRPEIWSNPV
jgi:hypothetical protein